MRMYADRSNILVRLFLAAITAVLLIVAIPVFFSAIGFPLNADLNLLFRLAVAGGAIWYVLAG